MAKHVKRRNPETGRTEFLSYDMTAARTWWAPPAMRYSYTETEAVALAAEHGGEVVEAFRGRFVEGER